jgi:hypothetical protein
MRFTSYYLITMICKEKQLTQTPTLQDSYRHEHYDFYAPISKDLGAYSFWPLRLFVCLSAKTLTLAISFEW